MIRKLLVAATLLAAFGHAFAAVDVNAANEDALRGIKGIGPARAKAILDERTAHGPFADAADLGRRVKGMGGHTIERLQAEGLSVGPANAQADGSSTAAQTTQTTPQAAQARAAPSPSPSPSQKQPTTVTLKK